MKRLGILLTFALTATTSLLAERVVIETKQMTMVIDVDEGRQPQYRYFGARLSAEDIAALPQPVGGRMDVYPAYGQNAPAEAALAMRHTDGNMSTELVATGIERLKNDGNQVTIIHLKDKVYPLAVDLLFQQYRDVDMIEAWTRIKTDEKAGVTLTQFASLMLPIRRGDVWRLFLCLFQPHRNTPFFYIGTPCAHTFKNLV